VPADKFVAPDVTQHDFQMALGDWDNGPDPDVSAFWRSNATPPDGVNVSGAPPDPFLDQALDILASATDGQARIAAAASVSHDLAVDAPAVFLYTPVDSYVVHSSLAGTPVPSVGGSAARFADIATWHH
jgi:ABC-type transport system substrate-binding protein